MKGELQRENGRMVRGEDGKSKWKGGKGEKEGGMGKLRRIKK